MRIPDRAGRRIDQRAEHRPLQGRTAGDRHGGVQGRDPAVTGEEAGTFRRADDRSFEDGPYDYRNNRSDFVGDVRVDEPRMELLCERMRVILREAPGAETAAETLFRRLAHRDAGTRGSRELDRIQCSGGVQVTRKDAAGRLLPGERAMSDDAVFEYNQRKLR